MVFLLLCLIYFIQYVCHHFELELTTSFFCVWRSSFPSITWWRLSFLIEWSWSLVKNVLGSFFYIGLHFCFIPVPYYINYCSFLVNFEIRKRDSSSFVLFHDCFGYAWYSGKEPAYQCRRCKRLWFNHCVRKIPWNIKWQPTPVFLLGKFHGLRSLVVYSL